MNEYVRQAVVRQIEHDKERRRRPLEGVEPFILTASNGKSLQHYVEHIRPQVAKPGSKALFLNEKGERFHPNDLGMVLSKPARRFGPTSHPPPHGNGARRPVYYVADWIGDRVATVERHYIHKARARAEMPGEFHVKRRRMSHANTEENPDAA